MDDKKQNRGGKRDGSGRPTLSGARMVTTSITIRADQKEALKMRGDVSGQIREAIDLYLAQSAHA